MSDPESLSKLKVGEVYEESFLRTLSMYHPIAWTHWCRLYLDDKTAVRVSGEDDGEKVTAIFDRRKEEKDAT